MFGHPIDKEDILNLKLGYWTVLSVVNNHSTGRTAYNCLCICGTFSVVKRAALINGSSQSCGCIRNKSRQVNLSGKTFGRLLVISTIPGSRKDKIRSKSICKCSCGVTIKVETSNLSTGNTLSCGCLQNQKAVEASKAFWIKKKTEEFGTYEEYRLHKKIKTRLRSRIWYATRRVTRIGSAIKDLNCSIEQLKKHLESKFTPGMSWENYGLGPGKWQIDHIKRLDDFDLSNREQFKEACHYTNLQPLSTEEHLIKTMKENR